MRRNPVLVTGAAATTLALLAGLGATFYQANLARDAEARARRELYAAEMVLATRDVADPATSQQVRVLTERWRPSKDLAKAGIEPGFEWQLLDSVRRRRMVEMKTPYAPLPIAWSQDATRVAVGMGGKIGIYDAATGEELGAVTINPEQPSAPLLTHLSWPPESPETVYFSGVQARGAWDVRTDAPAWSDDPQYSSSHALLPDGRLLSLRENDSLDVLDAATGELIDNRPGPWYQAGHVDVHRASGKLILPTRNWNSVVHDASSFEPLPSDLTPLEAIT